MGCGVINDTHLDPVPGTATLEDVFGANAGVNVEHVKHLKHGKGGIILVPQPSDDPDDPLNWPIWRRDLITFLLCLLAVLASTLSPLLAANTITLLVWFGGITTTGASALTAYHLLGVGIAGFFVVPLARVWGKRWLILAGTLIIVVSSIWGGCSGHNYNSLVAARFFQGVGLAPFEGLINAMVGELYFVHESGKRMAFSNLCLFGGAFFTPVIVGKLTASLGWQWTFWMVAIFTAAVLPAVYLLCPETTFNRGGDCDSRNIMSRTGSNDSPIEGKEFGVSVTGEQTREDSKAPSTSERPDGFSFHPYPNQGRSRTKLITRKSLALFNGHYTNVSFWQLLLRPLPLFLHPGILWSCLIQGAMIAWVAMLGVSLALIMLQIGFTEVQTGYMYSGAFIGAICGFIMAGLISDPFCRFMAKRNHGIFEPEFRLILAIPTMIFGCAGLFGYGFVAADIEKYGWLPADVFFGFTVGGMTLGAIVAAQYIIDGHREIAVEGLTCMVMFKNLVAFGVVLRGFDWLEKLGAKETFFMFAYIQVAITVSSIPMYIFGKVNRSFFARYDLLRLLRLS